MIIIECINTVFGDIRKTFTSQEQALAFMQVCIDNNVMFNVTYE